MRRWRALVLLVGFLGLVAMALYVPRVRVERVYTVTPARGSGTPVVTMQRSDKVQKTIVRPEGYGWVWSLPDPEAAFFGSEVEHRIDWFRLTLQAVIWVLFMGATAIAVGRLPRRG
jgi:hypothetical protein